MITIIVYKITGIIALHMHWTSNARIQLCNHVIGFNPIFDKSALRVAGLPWETICWCPWGHARLHGLDVNSCCSVIVDMCVCGLKSSFHQLIAFECSEYTELELTDHIAWMYYFVQYHTDERFYLTKCSVVASMCCIYSSWKSSACANVNNAREYRRQILDLVIKQQLNFIANFINSFRGNLKYQLFYIAIKIPHFLNCDMRNIDTELTITMPPNLCRSTFMKFSSFSFSFPV